MQKPDFSILIHDIRIQLGLSQEAMAHEFGVSFATINRWENGKALPSNLGIAHFKSHCEKLIDMGKLIMPASGVLLLKQ